MAQKLPQTGRKGGPAPSTKTAAAKKGGPTPARGRPEPEPRRSAPAPRGPSREVATAASAGLPANLEALMGEDEGAGLSSHASDNLVPLIYVLQPLSPQCMKQNEAYIEGSEPGMFWLRNADPSIQLQEEFWFQPCSFNKEWLEWIPRKAGGGFQGRYPIDPRNPDTPPASVKAERYKDPDRPQSIRWRLPNGNDLVQTRNYAGYVMLNGVSPLPYNMSLASTFHTFGKELMLKANGRTTSRGGRAPIFSSMYLIGTKHRSNNAGEWYVPELRDVQWITDEEQYIMGRQLQQAFESGDIRAEAPEDYAEHGDGNPDGKM